MTVATNPLLEVLAHGQSLWYDNIRRALIASGELAQLVERDGLRGVTSNPTIFAKAIAGSSDYDAALTELRAAGETDPKRLYEALAVRDVQDAADVMAPVYARTDRLDGYVSLEVAPTLAHDAEGTRAEARRLWRLVDRANLMVKVPATEAGITVVRRLVAEGINVNVTLLFAVATYERVADAYLSGLEDRLAAGAAIDAVASVASFFVSRIDAAVDARLGADSPLRGQVAIANAKLAYERYRALVASDRWTALAAHGARPQRLLWASTSTKDPARSDVLYVEALIGPDTVDTVPPATFDAFRDHGRPAAGLTAGVDHAREVMGSLGDHGVDFEAQADLLLREGLAAFEAAFAELLAAVGERAPKDRRPHEASLPASLEAELAAELARWAEHDGVGRLWARDATLWTDSGESEWLGWLGIADEQLAHPEQLASIGRDVAQAGFTHVALLGMGGSSLFPELLALTFGRRPGAPELLVLDSTDPAQVRAFEARLALETTLFVVSSKSGTTLEPDLFLAYFHARVAERLGEEEAGRRFVAVTDPGSPLEAKARAQGFRHVAHGRASIGGRYSALSAFGMVPAAAMGLDVQRLLHSAQTMAHACASCVPAHENPGLVLGATIGVAARAGRDKLTLVASPGIADLGTWLEQLLAESTGKKGRGVIPVDREPLGAPEAYGEDRLFVAVRLDGEADPEQDSALDALAAAGHPVVRLALPERHALGGEVFRWELATAVAGAILAINPFDQPDVEAAKVATRALTEEYERTGALPAQTPLVTQDGLALFADAANAAALGDGPLPERLRAHLARLGPGDYLALLAFVERTPEHEEELARIRRLVRDATRAATVAGFGPRFLHSTGQAYKGGPPTGVVVQVTAEPARDLDVPGRAASFGVIEAAQARGDLAVLADRARRAVRVHLGPDVAAGLRVLRETVAEALTTERG